MGNQSIIAQGVIGGNADAAHLGYTFSKVVQRHGFRVLADLAKYDIPYQGIGIVARRSFLDQSPDIAERTIKALAKSVTYFQDPANKQSAVAILAKWLRLARVEEAVAGYEMIRPIYTRRLFPTTEGVHNALRILSRVDPKFGKLKAEDLIDERIVRKLEKDGVFKSSV